MMFHPLNAIGTKGRAKINRKQGKPEGYNHKYDFMFSDCLPHELSSINKKKRRGNNGN